MIGLGVSGCRRSIRLFFCSSPFGHLWRIDRRAVCSVASKRYASGDERLDSPWGGSDGGGEEMFPQLSQEALVRLHEEIAMNVMSEKDAEEFADTLLATTGPPPPNFAYIRSVFKEPDALRWVRTETFRQFERESSSMITSPEQGEFLQLLIRALNAKKVLDVGTFTGYSSTAMAMALSDVSVLTIDLEEQKSKEIAREAWRRANIQSQIKSLEGDALEIMKLLPKDSFDLVFVDADKDRYEEYYELAMDLVRVGGMVLIDDSLWSGRLADETVQDSSTVAIRSVNEKIAEDPDVYSSLVPIHDGMTVAVKKRQRKRIRSFATTTSESGEKADAETTIHPLAGKIISFEGNIGCGKTTLLKKISKDGPLSHQLLMQIFYENPIEAYLRLFYEDPERHGFGFQLHMLHMTQSLISAAKQHSAKGGVSLVDRSAWGNSCFADCNYRLGRLLKDEMAVYEALFLSQPLGIDGMVYLDVPPEESLRRCRQRGSESEMEIELDYLEHLETSHFEKLLKSLEENQFPVLVLDWRQFQPPATIMKGVASLLTKEKRSHPRVTTVTGAAAAEEPLHITRSDLGRLIDDLQQRNKSMLLEDLNRPDGSVRVERILPYVGDAEYGAFKRAVLELLSRGWNVSLVQSLTSL